MEYERPERERDKQNFVDYVRIFVKAGDGGAGCVSFLRDKHIIFGGPNGGDGGRGGSIYLEAEREMVTLLDFKVRPAWTANRGEHGQGYNRSGRGADDIILKVPLGTTVIDLDNNVELGDLTADGQRLLVAKGGDGGRGNQHFATNTNKAPRKYEEGFPGEQRHLALELKVIADIGLVGLPNAGKSTLLSRITSAHPKIAPYPFTTINPNLGIMVSDDFEKRVTIADLPGLIEGAHRGAGLGSRFLRHIERTRALVHLVAPPQGTTESGDLTLADTEPHAYLYAYDLVMAELSEYSDKLKAKPQLVCLTKTDLIDPESLPPIIAAFRDRGIEVHPISSQEGLGLEELKTRIFSLLA